jgi:hypothetical protein
MFMSHPSVSIETDTTQRIDSPIRPLYLTEQIHVSDIFRLLSVSSARDNLSPKAVNFVASHITKLIVQGISGFKLRAVN